MYENLKGRKVSIKTIGLHGSNGVGISDIEQGYVTNIVVSEDGKAWIVLNSIESKKEKAILTDNIVYISYL